ncbi:MAG TPA: DUF2239 family protein [Polyangiaceae bacterium]|nr:DUF2239 family protein [Polyangiaceae bacterium]
MADYRTFTAFAGEHWLATGAIEQTLTTAKEVLDRGETETVLVFEDQTGAQIDFDWRGSAADVLARLSEHPCFIQQQEAARTGPGRPKLGVISREVSLLPRHWQWLEAQSGGISGALRRLIDEARRATQGKEDMTRARDAMSRFMWAIAGNLPGFEEASRALFADDYPLLLSKIEAWPNDIRTHLERLAVGALSGAAKPRAEQPSTNPHVAIGDCNK